MEIFIFKLCIFSIEATLQAGLWMIEGWPTQITPEEGSGGLPTTCSGGRQMFRHETCR